MGNYEERKIEKAKTCYSCQQCLGLDSDYEECYKSGFCMLDVSQADIEHVEWIVADDEVFDSKFCETMKVKPEDIIEDSPRCTEPNDVCQFYEKRVDE